MLKHSSQIINQLPIQTRKVLLCYLTISLPTLSTYFLLSLSKKCTQQWIVMRFACRISYTCLIHNTFYSFMNMNPYLHYSISSKVNVL